MSDEEKKVIEYFKRRIANKKTAYTSIYFKIEKLDALIKLIEKQSKEIEEYKKQLDLDYVKNNYTSNDKIKAKIEEYERNKWILEEKSQGIFSSLDEIGRIDTNIKFYDAMIKEMQSLLEKE